MLHSLNMQQSYEMWKKAAQHLTLAKLNASLTSMWPPQMLINEYYKKKGQSVNRKPRALKKWPTSTSSGLAQCTELFYSRFSSQEQLEGPLPLVSDFLKVLTAVVHVNPELGHPEGKYIALCACSKESYECVEFPTLSVNLKSVAEWVYWVLLVFCDGREDHTDTVEVHECVQYWRLLLLCLFVPLCV